MASRAVAFDMRSAHPASLVAGAAAALDDDIDAVRDCLARLSELLATVAAPAPVPQCRSGGLAPWQLRSIDRHVAANLKRAISVAELAALVRVSPGHLCRAFKASTGDTPHGYVTRRRIRHVQSLMLTTDWSLATIAGAAGLADQAHLSRLFRRHVGTAPLSWRRTWQQPA